MVIAVEKDVVDSVVISTVRACGVVISVGPEMGGIVGIECMAGDELKGGGLVCTGLGGENSFDEGMKG